MTDKIRITPKKIDEIVENTINKLDKNTIQEIIKEAEDNKQEKPQKQQKPDPKKPVSPTLEKDKPETQVDKQDSGKNDKEIENQGKKEEEKINVVVNNVFKSGIKPGTNVKWNEDESMVIFNLINGSTVGLKVTDAGQFILIYGDRFKILK